MGMSLPYVGVFAVTSTLLYLYGAGGGSYVPLVTWVVVAGVVYYISLLTHPARSCWSCGGSTRHRGMVWAYGSRPCQKCDGTGRHPRWGTRFVNKTVR
jgi:hypothetical protein